MLRNKLALLMFEPKQLQINKSIHPILKNLVVALKTRSQLLGPLALFYSACRVVLCHSPHSYMANAKTKYLPTTLVLLLCL